MDLHQVKASSINFLIINLYMPLWNLDFSHSNRFVPVLWAILNKTNSNKFFRAVHSFLEEVHWSFQNCVFLNSFINFCSKTSFQAHRAHQEQKKPSPLQPPNIASVKNTGLWKQQPPPYIKPAPRKKESPRELVEISKSWQTLSTSSGHDYTRISAASACVRTRDRSRQSLHHARARPVINCKFLGGRGAGLWWYMGPGA